eukprot:GFYU01012953.1.p1 GENE.GFYU01012953.1~~GFYU01012953.1.p1  ORF type:complete len:543 (-),score=80.49 GFYU01012953.1:1219-2847(-)
MATKSKTRVSNTGAAVTQVVPPRLVFRQPSRDDILRACGVSPPTHIVNRSHAPPPTTHTTGDNNVSAVRRSRSVHTLTGTPSKLSTQPSTKQRWSSTATTTVSRRPVVKRSTSLNSMEVLRDESVTQTPDVALLETAIDSACFQPIRKPTKGDWLRSHEEKGQSMLQFKRKTFKISPHGSHDTIVVRPLRLDLDPHNTVLGCNTLDAIPLDWLSRWLTSYFPGVKVKMCAPVDALCHPELCESILRGDVHSEAQDQGQAEESRYAIPTESLFEYISGEMRGLTQLYTPTNTKSGSHDSRIRHRGSRKQSVVTPVSHGRDARPPVPLVDKSLLRRMLGLVVLTDVDLTSPDDMLRERNWVRGIANPVNGVALCSVARMDPEFPDHCACIDSMSCSHQRKSGKRNSGDGSDVGVAKPQEGGHTECPHPQTEPHDVGGSLEGRSVVMTTLMRRLLTILTHEVCHLFGLMHCIYFKCIMNGASVNLEDFGHPMFLCPVCLHKLRQSITFDDRDRYSNLLTCLSELEELHFNAESNWLMSRIQELEE